MQWPGRFALWLNRRLRWFGKSSLLGRGRNLTVKRSEHKKRAPIFCWSQKLVMTESDKGYRKWESSGVIDSAKQDPSFFLKGMRSTTLLGRITYPLAALPVWWEMDYFAFRIVPWKMVQSKNGRPSNSSWSFQMHSNAVNQLPSITQMTGSQAFSQS